MSTSNSEENQDLQTYLDSFNKEIENESNASSENEEQEFYVDEVGDYYYDVKAEEPTKTKSNKPSTSVKTRAKAAKAINEKSEIDFLFVMDDNSIKQVVDDPEEENEDKEIYDFDENEEEDLKPPNELLMEKEVVQLKAHDAAKEPKSYYCMKCDYTANKPYLVSRHLKTHSDDRPFQCEVCDRGFKTNAALMNHVNTHLGKKPHRCSNCTMCFTTSGELVRHTRYRHTHEKPHKCIECEYSSVELSKLRRHMRCHTGERPYQCPHCTYASPDSFKLKRHMRTHTGEKPYECDICNARFTQSNSLKAHKLIHSVGDRPVFQCSLCPTTCGRKTDLRLHVQKLHHSDQPIKCKRCGLELPDRYSYKVHIKTHDGEKCYQCNYCSYASTSQRHLDSHLLIHTDTKPFVCSHCSMCFRQHQLLKRHINLYHNSEYVAPAPREKVHSCMYCSRTFTHKGNLMRHLQMHDPEIRPKTIEEKMQLKAGRLRRIEPNNSAEVFLEEAEETSTEEDYELIETIEDEMMVQKPTNLNTNDTNETKIRSFSIKKELGGKDFMAVEVDDNQQYMIEVIQCDEEDLEDEDIENTTMHMQLPIDLEKSNLENNFGFEGDEDENVEFYDETKQTIHLLNIINDN